MVVAHVGDRIQPERSVRGLLRREAGDLPGPNKNRLTHPALAKVEVLPTKDACHHTALKMDRLILVLIEFKKMVVDFGRGLA